VTDANLSCLAFKVMSSNRNVKDARKEAWLVFVKPEMSFFGKGQLQISMPVFATIKHG
jgi:hypothetical protein